MSYLEMVKADVLKYIEEEGIPMEDLNFDDPDNVSTLVDRCWACDSVTGNASGSYTFSRAKAKEYVLADFGAVVEALAVFDCEREEIGEHFIEEDWEWFDVLARLANLAYACELAMMEVYDPYETIMEEEQEAQEA